MRTHRRHPRPAASLNAARTPLAARLAAGLAGIAAAASLTATVVSPVHAAAQLSPQWPTSSAQVGASRWVTGAVPAAATPGSVTLEQKVAGGWHAVARDQVSDDGRYAVRVPTWWLGTREYRLRSSVGALSASWTARVVPAYTPSGVRSQHKYQVTSEVARWNPCETIGWRVTDASPGALKDAKEAFRRIGQATGFAFAYRGTSSRVPQYDANSWYPSDTQIVVAWTPKRRSSLFSAHPSADAVGAAYYYDGYRNGDGTPARKIVKGMVVIDSARSFAAGFGRGVTRGEVLLHEIGHTMGLSHVGATSQRMYPYWTSGAARLGRGDLAGLENRGAKLGCLVSSYSARAQHGSSAGHFVVND